MRHVHCSHKSLTPRSQQSGKWASALHSLSGEASIGSVARRPLVRLLSKLGREATQTFSLRRCLAAVTWVMSTTFSRALKALGIDLEHTSLQRLKQICVLKITLYLADSFQPRELAETVKLQASKQNGIIWPSHDRRCPVATFSRHTSYRSADLEQHLSSSLHVLSDLNRKGPL